MCSFSYTINTTNVTLEELINIYLFLKFKFFQVFNQFELLLVIFYSIQWENQDIWRFFNPSFIYADLTSSCGLVVTDFSNTRTFPSIHQLATINIQHYWTHFLHIFANNSFFLRVFVEQFCYIYMWPEKVFIYSVGVLI